MRAHCMNQFSLYLFETDYPYLNWIQMDWNNPPYLPGLRTSTIITPSSLIALLRISFLGSIFWSFELTKLWKRIYMNEYVKTNILPFRYLTLNSHFLSHKIFLEKMTKKTPFWLFLFLMTVKRFWTMGWNMSHNFRHYVIIT